MDGKKIEIIPYLPFNGNCEEAISTYIKAYGGKIYHMTHWSESEYDLEPEQREKVLHAEFTLGNVSMAAGDNVDSIETSADISLMVHLDSEEEVVRVIALLGEGGTVLSPLHARQTSDDNSCEAILTDRFGITWIITCQNTVK